MKLSIAFITRNRKKELLRALNSCINGLLPDSEIIIVDNSSTDGTEDYIKENFNFKNLKYSFETTNHGVAGGRNIAFSLCEGEYVFFLDDDAIIVGNTFWKEIIDYMDNHKSVVALSPNIQEPVTNTNLNCKNIYESENNIEILSYCGCAHILRKDFFSAFGTLYPPKLMFGSEELYSSIIAWSKNKKVVWLENVRVEHYPSIINRHSGDERKLDFIINQYVIKKITYPAICLPITWFIYTLHKVKHGFYGLRLNREIKKKVQMRYSTGLVERISIKSWYSLFNKFGWKGVL
ncbi:glycosyltransferase [Clostridium perfringens]|nr:hypothetical protein CPBEC3_19460 [Clostridium perfringens]HCG3172931.1 glycosyltransferase [Clostridium perfringens]